MVHDLKEARLILGISLKQVSEDLNIREEYVKALEDSVQSFIPDVYLKGYAKMYSKYLDRKMENRKNSNS